jgi:hypothetical protein
LVIAQIGKAYLRKSGRADFSLQEVRLIGRPPFQAKREAGSEFFGNRSISA